MLALLKKRKQVTRIKTRVRGRIPGSSFRIPEPFHTTGYIIISLRVCVFLLIITVVVTYNWFILVRAQVGDFSITQITWVPKSSSDGSECGLAAWWTQGFERPPRMLRECVQGGGRAEPGGGAPTLTVWLFSMNCTALSFTSFRTLLYVKTKEGGQGKCEANWES